MLKNCSQSLALTTSKAAFTSLLYETNFGLNAFSFCDVQFSGTVSHFQQCSRGLLLLLGKAPPETRARLAYYSEEDEKGRPFFSYYTAVVILYVTLDIQYLP